MVYNNNEEVLTLEDFCNRLSISPTTAYRLLKSGEVKGFRLGGWKIPVSSVDEYIKKRCEQK